MKETFSKVYLQPMTMMKYDSTHILGYLNEEVIDNYVPERGQDDEEAPQPTTGYRYTGTERDGGTLLPCADDADYGELTNAIIRASFSESDELAIQRHYKNDPQSYADEWAAYNQACESAKAKARQWLGLD